MPMLFLSKLETLRRKGSGQRKGGITSRTLQRIPEFLVPFGAVVCCGVLCGGDTPNTVRRQCRPDVAITAGQTPGSQ